MRRIVVIAAGPAGVSCATRIKRRMHEHEINVVLPAKRSGQDEDGPASRRVKALLPNVEALAARELGVLESNDIMTSLSEREITVGSDRGTLPIRYTDLVVEVPATVRLPRALHKAENVFSWPMPGFAADPDPLDRALAQAAESGEDVLVVGNGAQALEAVLLVREAGAGARWLRTGERGSPALESQLLALALRRLGSEVVCVDMPDIAPEHLTPTLNDKGDRLESLTLPDGVTVAGTACLWTSPLMARHPLLREDGVVLDDSGRIIISEPERCPGLILMGDGAAVMGGETAVMGDEAAVGGARHAVSGLVVPAMPGGLENAGRSGWIAVDAVTGTKPTALAEDNGALAVRSARGAGLVFLRAGFSIAEAANRGIDAEYAAVSLPDSGDDMEEGDADRLCLTLVCDKHSRTLLGAQVLGPEAGSGDCGDLFMMALDALAEETPLSVLSRRLALGRASRLARLGATVLVNKLDNIIKGISPDELRMSRERGAEFFTLDLRSLPDWRAGHVEGAYNIPLRQLKKRIQDEVPRFTPLVLISATGRDAYVAACRMAGLGATDLYVLDGGMAMWPYSLEKEKK